MSGYKLATTVDCLQHLSEPKRHRVDRLDKKIYDMQGKCRTRADTVKLSKMYRRMWAIIKGVEL